MPPARTSTVPPARGADGQHLVEDDAAGAARPASASMLARVRIAPPSSSKHRALVPVGASSGRCSATSAPAITSRAHAGAAHRLELALAAPGRARRPPSRESSSIAEPLLLFAPDARVPRSANSTRRRSSWAWRKIRDSPPDWALPGHAALVHGHRGTLLGQRERGGEPDDSGSDHRHVRTTAFIPRDSSGDTPHRGGRPAQPPVSGVSSWGRLELRNSEGGIGDGRPEQRRTVARGAGARAVRGGRVEHGQGVRGAGAQAELRPAAGAERGEHGGADADRLRQRRPACGATCGWRDGPTSCGCRDSCTAPRTSSSACCRRSRACATRWRASAARRGRDRERGRAGRCASRSTRSSTRTSS